VNRNGFAEPVKVTGDGEKFYDYYSGENEDYQRSKDSDTAAEWNDGLMVSVFGRMRDEPGASGQLLYNGR
jgi:hypothetical protein